MRPAILIERLEKSYGQIRALDGIDLQVAEGTVLGMLGPNGAGKTTAVRILTTLLYPDGGRAEVLGLDVVRDAATVRARIGLAGQYAAIDGQLTGRENLRLVGRLYRLPGAEAARRADELLEQFDLGEASSRPAKTYSGGMRRRLDLAASLVNTPPVLFLDEPTTGLDPRGRIGLWDIISRLVKGGTTVLLTTQYLEEADRLADRIAVIDGGRILAEGTADELKMTVGGTVLEVRVAVPSAADALRVLAALGQGEPQQIGESGQLHLPTTRGVGLVVEAARALDAAGITLADLSLRRPTLDDVFLTLTGHATADLDEPPAARADRRRAGGPSQKFL
ncbi:MAG: ATP-binding cassette domain-containing protein [Egibacteraceae bacterium]